MTRTRLAAALIAGLGTLALASPAYAAAPTITVDPAVVQTSPGVYRVTGTYRCDPSPLGTTGRLTVQLTQRPPYPLPPLAAKGLRNVTCTGNVEPYEVTARGNAMVGAAQVKAILSAVPTGQTAVYDGTVAIV